MKLFSYVTLGLLATTDAAPKKKKSTKKIKYCHQIKKGENKFQYIDPNSNKKPCKCIVGWKKSKIVDPSDGQKKTACLRPNMSLLRRTDMIDNVSGTSIKAGEQKWKENQEQPGNRKCVIVPDANWIKCDNFGLDSKRIRKLILPYSIETADFSNNHLTSLERTQFEGLMDLKSISFRNNFLKKIPISVFKGSYNLEDLDISMNQLTELHSSGVFKKNINVKKFKANNNMLKDIKKKVISSWKNLEHLDVSNNRLTKLSGGMLVAATNLYYANFANNKIEKLATKAFTNNFNLRELYLNNNAISNINKKVLIACENLEVLDLSYNKIGEGRVSTKNDPDIHREAFRKLKSVKKLLLNNNFINKISPLQFKGLKNLELVNLDHNQIESLPGTAFTNSPNLKFVFARYNNIANVDAASFSTNPALKIAYLSHNDISEIDETLFEKKPDLKRIDLGDNKLTSVGDLFKGSQENMYNTYFYGNMLNSVDKDILAEAKNMAQLDVSDNSLTDGSLAFVPKVIAAAEDSDSLQWVNLKDNLFKDKSLGQIHTNFDKLNESIARARYEAAQQELENNQL